MKKMLLLLLLSAAAAVPGDVKVPAIFSDHAVLQKSSATAVFGMASPGEIVTVSYGGISASGAADKNGRFLVRLDLSKCDGSSRDLVFKAGNTVISKDVITGDVWLCAGQSNMRFIMRSVLNAEEEIRNSGNDRIRNFVVKNPQPFASGNAGAKSAMFAVGSWQKASPENTASFSAAGYFFARTVNEKTGVAIGLVDPSIGASSIEAWISRETLFNKISPAVAAESQEREKAYENYAKISSSYEKAYKKWAEKCSRDHSVVKDMPSENAKWQTLKKVPAYFRGEGVVWLRKSFTMKKSDISDKYIRFKMGYPGAETVLFIDGKKAGYFPLADVAAGKEFKVSVPADMVSAGEHLIQFRFWSPEKNFKLFSTLTASNSKVNIYDWQVFRERKYDKLTAEQLAGKPQRIPRQAHPQTLPGRIYDRKLHPLFPLSLKGVLWYQGENNSDKTRVLYAEMQTALIAELRKNFQNPDLPFYAVQLTSYKAKSGDPENTGTWPDVREQQSKVMLSVKNCYETVILDLGEAADIHPIAKQDVGRRLALCALANSYGMKDIPWQCPRAEKAVVKGSEVHVTFSATYGKLQAPPLPEYYWVNRKNKQKAKLTANSPGSEVEGFSLCGKDGKWHWAEAKISGSSVIVKAAGVPEPAGVRYARQDNPNCNLYNAAGLPAHPLQIMLK